MAEKKIIVDIDIKADDIKAAREAQEAAAKSMVEYQQQINKLKTDQKELNALYKVGAIDSKEYAKKQTEIKTQLTETNKSMREANKTMQNNKTVVEAAKGSNEQLRARLSLLTKQYNGLSKEQRENTKQGKQLQANIKGISDKLKENEKAVGDNRRNVGNYESALKGVAGQINVMGVNLGSLASQLQTYKEGVVAGAAATKASSAATGGFSKALNILKVALISTGIGAIVVALGAMVTYLTQTKRGAEQLSQVLAGVGAAISVVVDRISSIGEAVVNVFTGDGSVMDVIGTTKEAFTGLTDEIVKETKAAAGLEKQMQKLRDKERELTVDISKRKAEVAALQLLAEDETKSFAERQAAITKANAIQEEQMQRELALQKERVAIVEEQLALGENLEEDEQKLAEERAKLGEIEAANLKKLRTLKAKENSIRNQQASQARKQEQELRKATEEQIKLEEDAAAKRKAIRDQFERDQMSELERRKADAIAKANILREAGVAEKEIESFLSEELIAIHRAEQDAILDAKIKRLDDEAALAKAKIQAEIQDAETRKLAILEIEAELAEAKQQELDLEIQNYSASTEALGYIDEERNAQLLLRKQLLDAAVIETDKAKKDAILQHIAEIDAALEDQRTDEEKARDAVLATTVNALQGVGNIIQNNIRATEEQMKAAGKTQEEIEAQTKEARKTAQGFAVAAALVQTFQAAIAAYQSGSAVPIVGVALGPIAAAAAVAFGLAQVAQIKKQKFADGGVAQGPSHAQGGIPFTVAGHGGYEMEGDEIILTKGVYRDPELRQQASVLNQLGGGKALTPGTYMAAGGVASATVSTRGASANATAALESRIDSLGDRISEMKIYTNVNEINRVNGQQAKIVQSADL